MAEDLLDRVLREVRERKKRAQAASTLTRLARQGAIERYSPPGGGTAYRPPFPTPDSDFTSTASPAAGGVEERESLLAEDKDVDTAKEQRERDAPVTDSEP